jgi:hypothetical protein
MRDFTVDMESRSKNLARNSGGLHVYFENTDLNKIILMTTALILV